MKIPFTLDAWLKDKSQKVETRDGRTARIICTDAKADDGACIIALIPGYGGEEAYQFFPDGRAFSSKSSDEDCANLFIITPEPELSEFEKRIRFTIDEVVDGRYNADNIEDVKGIAKGLLALAREQIIKDGYVIEKKTFHYAVEKVASEVMKEVSDKVDMEKALRLGYEKGRADALKDLPRWKKWENGACGNGQGIPIAIVKRGLNGYELVDALGIQGEQYIMLSDLEKLAGFKE